MMENNLQELKFESQIEIDWLKKWAMYAPESVALVDGDTGREITYAKLYESAKAFADILQTQYQVKRHDRIVVLSLNELEYVFLFFACVRLGACLVPVNYRLTAPEVEHIVKDSDCRLIVYQTAFLGSLETVLSFFKTSVVLLNEGQTSLSKEAEKKISCNENYVSTFQSQVEDPAMIIYTSGTTGFPKGAVISHRMIFWNSINTTLRLNISQDDSTVIFLPFFHTGGWNVLTTPFLHRGAKIILLKKFDADQVLQLTEKHRGTILFGVPTTMDMMARAPSFATVNLKSVRYGVVGGEPMPIELINTWHIKGVSIRQGYGLTEFGPNVFSLNEADAIRKIGSIGFPNFYIDVRVVDENGVDVKVNEVGELWLKGPGCMSGYWRNETATRETIRDQWLATGDLVRFDHENYFYVVGRKKEMYKSGGENVYPAEVEKVIRGLKGIREVAVIGTPDDKWGEVGKAFVSVESGCDLSENHIVEYCLKNLAKFKVPRSVKFLPNLPKGESGKILKKSLQ
jgi:fatty-acyl-CoA synthase